jgi:hypothetical protein
MKKILIIISIISFGISQTQEFSGLVFFDYTYYITDAKDGYNEFQFKRTYFTFEKELPSGISYKFQTDMGYKDSGLDSDDGKNYMFVKNAMVKWKLDNGNLMIGLQGMNVFNISEKTWGHRFIEKTPIDRNKLASSADMGIGYAGKFNNLSYSLLITNGGGYKEAEKDKYKKVSFQLFHGEKKLIKNDGHNIGLSFAFEGYDTGTNTSETKSLVSLFGGFAGKGIRAGGEFDLFIDGGKDINSQIISVYGNYKLSDILEGFLRIDNFDPNTDENGDSEMYLIAGVIYQPVTGLTIAPNYRFLNLGDSDDKSMLALNFQFKF